MSIVWVVFLMLKADNYILASNYNYTEAPYSGVEITVSDSGHFE